jgi:uncharacterized protein YecE (DUF72 family)
MNAGGPLSRPPSAHASSRPLRPPGTVSEGLPLLHSRDDCFYVGTAGWSIPRASAQRCPLPGSHLERYARSFRCAEINSSFYRPHAAATYARWAASTPERFRFAVKLPRDITHVQELRRSRRRLEQFFAEIAGLGVKRGPVLIQLPPSLAFNTRMAGRFFTCLRSIDRGPLVCEPRHPSWFERRADALLNSFTVARVAADPARAPGADRPGGWDTLAYFRLHGSPHTYWSRYDDTYLDALARHILTLPPHVEAWTIFDNTAAGAALENAWTLEHRLRTTCGGGGSAFAANDSGRKHR